METWTIVGTIASIVGLFLTGLLLYVADKVKEAVKKAVNEARNFIFGSNLITELREIEKLLTNFDNEIENKNATILRYLIKQSCNKTSNFIAKYSNEIGSTSKIYWVKQELEELFQSISSKKDHEFTDSDVGRYRSVINKKLNDISEELGHFERKIIQEK